MGCPVIGRAAISQIGRQPWGERESPVEHVATTAADAIDDLNKVIALAETQGELVLLKDLIDSLIERLQASWTTAHTLDSQFYEMRGDK